MTKKKQPKKPIDPFKVIERLPKASQQVISLLITTRSRQAIEAYLFGGVEALVELHGFTHEQTQQWSEVAVQKAQKYLDLAVGDG